MPVVLTFGDSNTHGTPPITERGVYARYDAATRWPRRMIAGHRFNQPEHVRAAARNQDGDAFHRRRPV